MPRIGEPVSAAGLAALYAFPAPRRWVRANMVATVDGSATGPDGLSGSVNTPADNRVYAAQRAAADVVLVGAGTARAEGYGRVVGAPGLAPAALAVVSVSARVPDGLVGPREGRGRAILVTCAAAGQARLERARRLLGEADVWVCGGDTVDLRAALDRLAGEGMRRVLAEGGPSLLGDLLAADLVDEVAVTTTPLAVGGDGPRIVGGDGIRTDLRLHLLLEEAGTLLAVWRVRR